MPSPLAEAFLMGILNGCYETPSKMCFTTSCGIGCKYTYKFVNNKKKKTK